MPAFHKTKWLVSSTKDNSCPAASRWLRGETIRGTDSFVDRRSMAGRFQRNDWIFISEMGNYQQSWWFRGRLSLLGRRWLQQRTRWLVCKRTVAVRLRVWRIWYLNTQWNCEWIIYKDRKQVLQLTFKLTIYWHLNQMLLQDNSYFCKLITGQFEFYAN